MEGDLKVEHTNCKFKASLMKLSGNYTDEGLQRCAKSLEITDCLQEKLYPHYVDRLVEGFNVMFSSGLLNVFGFSEESMMKDRLGHRTGDWSDQVRRGVLELCVRTYYLFACRFKCTKLSKV